MLVPAAPPPSRLSATPQCFFSQIGHCDDLGLGLKNLVLFTSLPFDDDYVEYMTVYLLTYYIEGRLIYHGYIMDALQCTVWLQVITCLKGHLSEM